MGFIRLREDLQEKGGIYKKFVTISKQILTKKRAIQHQYEELQVRFQALEAEGSSASEKDASTILKEPGHLLDRLDR